MSADPARLAGRWHAEVLPQALERLVPFLEAKLARLGRLGRLARVEVLPGDPGPELVLGPARLTFTVRPGLALALGAGPAGGRLEVLAAVTSDVASLATARLAEAPLEEASAVWAQQVVLRFLHRLVPHLPPRPEGPR